MAIVSNRESSESKLPTTNYLSSWKVHLYHKIDSDRSEISKKKKQAHQSIPAFKLCCIIVDDWGEPEQAHTGQIASPRDVYIYTGP